MTDIEGFLTIYGHSDNLLNNNAGYLSCRMTDIEGFLAIYGHSDNLLNNNKRYTEMTIFGSARALLIFFHILLGRPL